MKRAILIILISVNFNSFSQKIGDEYPNSRQLIGDGIKLYDEGKPEEALELYKKVHPCDSFYYFAQYEVALCYTKLKKEREVISTCLHGLKLNSEEERGFLDLIGSAYDELKIADSANYYYDLGIKKYPNYHKFHFEKAIVLAGKENDSAAINSLIRASKLNSLHPGTHFQLGVIAARNKNYTMAIMALQYFLFLENNTERSMNALRLLEKVCNDNVESVKNPFNINVNNNSNFIELDEIIKSRSAQIESYKTKVKLPYKDVIKQCQIIRDKFVFDDSDKSFFNQFFGKLFYNLYKEDYFESSIYSIFSGIRSEEIQSVILPRKNELEKFGQFALKLIDEYRNKSAFLYNGKEYNGRRFFYKNGTIEAYGNIVNEKKDGPFIFFNNKNNKSAEGLYVKDQKSENWKYYHTNGVLSSDFYYVNGTPKGKYQFFYDNGQLKEVGTYENEKLTGEIILYASNGSLKEKIVYKNGVLDGPYESYSLRNNLRTKATYVNGKVEGKVLNYSNCGRVSEERTFVKGAAEGDAKEYYSTGELKISGNYKDGKENGLWTWYYTNGKKMKEGEYKDGKYCKTWTQYYLTGQISSIFNYNSDSELDGEFKEFAKNGNLTSEGKYKNGKLQLTIYYDLNKNKVEEINNSKSNYTFKRYYPTGTLKEEGEIKDLKPEGKYKSYYPSGALEQEYSYSNGVLNGLDIRYHKNGKVRIQCLYKDGKFHGYYKVFREDESLDEEGYYCEGKRCGELINYYQNGVKSKITYFVNDEEITYSEYFDLKGRITKRSYFDDVITHKEEFFDTLGKVYNTYNYKTGNNPVTYYYCNMSKEETVNDAYGKKDGKQTIFYPNGSIASEVEYKLGERNGVMKNYDLFGKLIAKKTYSTDLPVGKWEFFDNEKLDYEESYFNGELHGKKVWYYENGKVQLESNYYLGEKDSLSTFYGEDGSFGLKLMYNDGVLIAYSTHDKSGNLIPFTPIKNETVKIDAYYKNGKKARECNYVNGLLQGKRVSYFTNGAVFIETNFIDDMIDGKSVEYYINGKLKSESVYKFDERNGIEKIYYDNGMLKSETNYVIGYKYGYEKLYDKTGKLIKSYFNINGDPF